MCSFFKYESIDFEFGPSPVSSLGIVPDFVIGLVAEPVGQRPVLSLSLGQPLFYYERFVGTLHYQQPLTIEFNKILYLYG